MVQGYLGSEQLVRYL